MTAELAWPLRLGPDGDFAVLELGSYDEIAQSVRIIASTRPGDRGDTPGVGVDDPVPALGFDAPAWVAAIERWEPRATVTATPSAGRLLVTVTLTDADDGSLS